MIISSAGMPGPFLLRGAECKVLNVAGIPPGLLPDITYDELSVLLEPGDSVLFCTDGLTEAHNLDNQELGLEGIQEICRHHSGDAPLDLLGRLFCALEDFTHGQPQWEDMTATALRYSSH